MAGVTDTIAEIRSAQARAGAAVTQATAARLQGNVGQADILIVQAQEESNRAAALAQVAQTQATQMAQAELVQRRQRPVLGFRVPWWAWAGAGLGSLWLLMRKKGRRR